MGWWRRFRERLVLGHVRRTLAPGEHIHTWVHARLPDVRAPGVLLVTNHRFRLHVASLSVDDRDFEWDTVDSWDLERRGLGQSKVRLTIRPAAPAIPLTVDINVTTAARARAATQVLAAIIERADRPTVAGADTTAKVRAAAVIPPPKRGVAGHLRRIGITVLGGLVLILSLVFASPFVPGPGALTAVAGIAILAREYEWAQDLHVWANRLAERFLAWLRRRTQAIRARRAARRAARHRVHDPASSSDDAEDRVTDAA